MVSFLSVTKHDPKKLRNLIGGFMKNFLLLANNFLTAWVLWKLGMSNEPKEMTDGQVIIFLGAWVVPRGSFRTSNRPFFQRLWTFETISAGSVSRDSTAEKNTVTTKRLKKGLSKSTFAEKFTRWTSGQVRDSPRDRRKGKAR